MEDWDAITEDESGQLEFWRDGQSLGKFDSVADYFKAQESLQEAADGSEEVDRQEPGDNAETDSGSDDTGGDTASVGASSGDDAEGNEVSGNTGGIANEAGNTVTVENMPTDYATSAQLEAVASDLVVIQDHMEVVSASMTILIVLVAACFGVMAVQTLLHSFENW